MIRRHVTGLCVTLPLRCAVSLAKPIVFRRHQPDFTHACEPALEGIGLAFSLEDYVVPYLTSGALVRVLDDWCPPFAGFFLYYPSRRQQPAAL